MTERVTSRVYWLEGGVCAVIPDCKHPAHYFDLGHWQGEDPKEVIQRLEAMIDWLKDVS